MPAIEQNTFAFDYVALRALPADTPAPGSEDAEAGAREGGAAAAEPDQVGGLAVSLAMFNSDHYAPWVAPWTHAVV